MINSKFPNPSMFPPFVSRAKPEGRPDTAKPAVGESTLKPNAPPPWPHRPKPDFMGMVTTIPPVTLVARATVPELQTSGMLQRLRLKLVESAEAFGAPIV